MKITTQPTTTANSLTELKQQVKILDTSFDTELTAFLNVAQSSLFNVANIMAGNGVVTASYSSWCDYFDIPIKGDIASVVVKYYDADNVEQTQSNEMYSGTFPLRVKQDASPTLYDRPDAINVEITFTTTTDPLIKQALNFIGADLFEIRQTYAYGAVKELNNATKHHIQLISARVDV